MRKKKGPSGEGRAGGGLFRYLAETLDQLDRINNYSRFVVYYALITRGNDNNMPSARFFLVFPPPGGNVVIRTRLCPHERADGSHKCGILRGQLVYIG